MLKIKMLQKHKKNELFFTKETKKKILWVSVKFAVIMRQRFNPSQDKSLIRNK